MNQSIPLIIAGFVVIFPVFWMAILMVIGRFGGWVRLARSYEADFREVNGPDAGDPFKMASARIGRLTGYNNCLKIIVSSRGVYLRPVWLLRVGHAPLFIPWDAMSGLKPSTVWLFTSVRLAIEDTNGNAPTFLTIYGRTLVDSILKHAPRHLSYEENH